MKIIHEGAPSETPLPAETVGQRLMKFAGTSEGLSSDFALNYDHYFYGAEQRAN